MSSRYNDSVQRISKIKWTNIGTIDKKSNVALAKEYLRRASLLIKTYTLDVKFPFFSAAQAFGKSQQIDIQKLCPEVDNSKNVFARRICECYLEWSILTDMENPAAIQFYDLYDPLITLFERCGSIGLHHGEVVVGKYAFPLKHWSNIALENSIDISERGLATWDI